MRKPFLGSTFAVALHKDGRGTVNVEVGDQNVAEERRTLTFKGRIVSGKRRYSKMVIPGRNEMLGAPIDWPTKLRRGSLNVLIEEYPVGFKPPQGRGIGGVYKLDDQSFRCAFVIPGERITNNELEYQGAPSPAQVWRARLDVPDNSLVIDCWVLRRMGSNVGCGMSGNVLEVVSDVHLRTEYDLHEDGQAVAVTLFEG